MDCDAKVDINSTTTIEFIRKLLGAATWLSDQQYKGSKTEVISGKMVNNNKKCKVAKGNTRLHHQMRYRLHNLMKEFNNKVTTTIGSTKVH